MLKIGYIAEQLQKLEEEIEQILANTMHWNSQQSEKYSEPCLKIAGADLGGDAGRQLVEIIHLNDSWMLTDEDGHQYNLSFLDISSQSKIVDYVQNVNPYSDEAKVFPVIKHDGKEDLENFPNFSVTGSVFGMKKKYYGMGAMLLEYRGYIYNVTSNPEIYLNQYDPEDEHNEEV